jgi:hypothetical protein
MEAATPPDGPYDADAPEAVDPDAAAAADASRVADVPVVSAPDDGPLAPGSGSTTTILDELRKRRQQIGDPTATVILPVNGYGGRLLARYRKLPLRDVVQARKKISKRNPDETTAALTLAANVLIDACEAFMVTLEPGANPVELQTTVEEFGADPIRYEPRLARALAFDDKLAQLPGPPRAVDVVRMTFDNTYALFDHFNSYDEWLKNAAAEDDESF